MKEDIPRWTRDPDVNKTDSGCFLIRVTLPVDPFHKTNSEVATINFVRDKTDMPVPRIIAFDDSSENELWFEWILMEMLPGETLRSKWRNLSWEAKERLVKQIAYYQSQLFRYQFDAIGNLFTEPSRQRGEAHNSESKVPTDVGQPEQDTPTMDQIVSLTSKLMPTDVEEPERETPTVGQIVSMIFFWDTHINEDIPRGPFTDSADWIRARLTLILADQEKILANSDDEDDSIDEEDIEDTQEIKEIVERLLKILPEILPPGTPERTTLFHDDLNMQNILVDNEGNITGIVDWEFVSALPLWRASRLPEFLEGRDRFEEPRRESYAPDSDDSDGSEDNEGVNGLYWIHLMEYELTKLRELFLETMRKTAPGWIEKFENGVEKADFEAAVQDCDNEFRIRRIKTWLDARENGKKWGLRKSYFE